MGEKLRKIQRSLKWKNIVRVVLRGKTVVQQYGVKTLNGNRNALKLEQMLSIIALRTEIRRPKLSINAHADSLTVMGSRPNALLL